MIIKLLVLLLFSQRCLASIYYLNETEYNRMPPIFSFDTYDTCIHANNDSGFYCSVNFDLVTDEPSKLYEMIRNYSAKTEMHLNHSKLFYGLCLTKKCTQFYKQNTTEDLSLILEECLNNSLWEDYKLKVRVETYTCDTVNEKIKFDTADIVVGAVIAVILMLNILGSLQEVFCGKNRTTLLFCFSVRRNWRRLIAPAEGPEPRLTRLKGFHGMKAILMLNVVMVHSLLPFIVNIENPRTFEEYYKLWYYQVLANGSLALQTFFLITGFLLVYNMQLESEKRKISWLHIPKMLIHRYLRLTLPYVVVLAVTATWLRHFGYGPLWQSVVVQEVDDCRRNWWLHPLYVNNYFDHSICLLETWYLAADFQLYVIGVLVCVLTAGKCRKIVLGLLLAAGVVLPAVHTYYQDLDAHFIFSPETVRNWFIMDNTFNHTYKRGHTNLAAFVIGLALGLLIFHWQTTGVKIQKTATRRFLIWLSYPSLLAVTLIGNLFFMDTPRLSVYIRALFAALEKPLFTGISAYFVFGVVFKFEDLYRDVVEWDGWRVVSRLAYSTYLIHVMIVRIMTGILTSTVIFSDILAVEVIMGTITLSLGAAFFFHLLIEAPSLQLVKLIVSRRQTDENDKNILNKSLTKDFVLNGIQFNCGQNTQGNGNLKGILAKHDILNEDKTINKTTIRKKVLHEESNETEIFKNENQNENDKSTESTDTEDADFEKQTGNTETEDTVCYKSVPSIHINEEVTENSIGSIKTSDGVVEKHVKIISTIDEASLKIVETINLTNGSKGVCEKTNDPEDSISKKKV